MPIPQAKFTKGENPSRPGGQSYLASITPPATSGLIDFNDPTGKSLRSIFFNPDEETAARIFHAFFDPNNSLAGIARDHSTTVEALTCWMARPDIAIRIHNIKHGAATHHSITATLHLKHAINALTIILQEYTDAACHEAGLKAGRGASASEHNRRDRETARKSAHLLARLANFDQSIRPPHNPRSNILTPDSLAPLPRSSGRGAGGSATAEGAREAPENPQDLLTEIAALLTHVGAQTPSATSNIPNPTSDIERGGTGGSPASDALQHHTTHSTPVLTTPISELSTPTPKSSPASPPASPAPVPSLQSGRPAIPGRETHGSAPSPITSHIPNPTSHIPPTARAP